MADQTNNPFSGEMYTIWERSMTQWWDQVLDSNTVLKAMGESIGHRPLLLLGVLLARYI